MKVSMLKLDPYINVDPGTMSPYQHGEVYVLDDGAETDLDLGTDGSPWPISPNVQPPRDAFTRASSRKSAGRHLGDGIIPYITNEIKGKINAAVDCDVCLRSAEPWATSSLFPFLEAIRQVL